MYHCIRWTPLACVMLLLNTAEASEADLDRTWHENGLLTVVFDNPGTPITDTPSDIARDSGGRIYLIGTVTTLTGSTAGLVRVLPNGQLDNSLDSDGKVQFTLPAQTSMGGYRVAVQADGKPIIGGSLNYQNGSGDSGALLCRRNVAGNADSSFASAALGCVQFGAQLVANGRDYFGDMEIDAQGRIWATQISQSIANGNDYRLVVHRFDANGVSDADFGPGGRRVFDIAGSFGVSLPNIGSHLAIDAQGRAVVAFEVLGQDLAFGMIRLLDNGSLDPGFHGDGFVQINPNRCGPACSEYLSDLDVLTNGDLLLTGTFNIQTMPSSTLALGLARVAPDGTLVAGFGDNGYVTDVFSDVSVSREATASLEMPDGKILVVGRIAFAEEQGLPRWISAVWRFQSDGSDDDDFGGGGRQFYDPFPGEISGFGVRGAVGVINDNGRPLVLNYGYPGVQSSDTDYGVFALQRRDVFASGFE
jgi:uncharacterized delta-60 repeat protein